MINFTPNTNIKTVTDYCEGYAKVEQAIRETDNPRTIKQLNSYRRKIGREIKDFDKFRGTNYGALIFI